jgi:hypothetical protein
MSRRSSAAPRADRDALEEGGQGAAVAKVRAAAGLPNYTEVMYFRGT